MAVVSAGLTVLEQLVPSVTQVAAQFGAANNTNERAAKARARVYTGILLAEQKKVLSTKREKRQAHGVGVIARLQRLNLRGHPCRTTCDRPFTPARNCVSSEMSSKSPKTAPKSVVRIRQKFTLLGRDVRPTVLSILPIMGFPCLLRVKEEAILSRRLATLRLLNSTNRRAHADIDNRKPEN